MRAVAASLLLLLAVAVAGCDEERAAAPAEPHELTAAAVGNYCGMQLVEHAGPKGQIILASQAEPVWFSSARDAFAFTMLPDEPKDIRAVYVSDMAKAASWDQPGTTNWVDASKAYFVIGSRLKGGMGADETVPFSTREAALRFAAENGGKVVGFADVPRDYVLGPGEAADAAPAEPSKGASHAHH